MDQEALNKKLGIYRLLFWFLSGGQIFAVLIVVFFLMRNEPRFPVQSTNLFVADIVISIAGICAGILVYRKRASNTRASALDQEKKVAVYTTTLCIQWIIVEILIMFSALAYVITGSSLILSLSVCQMFYYLIFLRPSSKKFAQFSN